MLHYNVVKLIELFANSRHRSPHTIGRLAAGSGDFYIRLKRGHDITTRRADRFAQWLSDHWPSDLDWPAEIPRPPRSAEAKKGAAA